MRFIEMRLDMVGHLNRDDLCGEFGISVQQASPEDTATQCVLEDMARVAAQGEDS
jgi:hypothetical protein